MIKRMMLAAAVAALACAALPALASAEYHINLANGSQTFSVAGGNASLVGTDAEENTVEISCSTSSGSGEFDSETSKTGTLSLAFHGCKETTTGFEFPCNSSGDPEGTITANGLSFHLATVHHSGETNRKGIVITPGTEQTHEGEPVFAEFECFIVSTIVGGNGIVGTVTSPGTKEESKTMTLSFEADSVNPHEQTHQVATINGVKGTYSLKSSVSGGPTTPASETATGTATLTSGEGILEDTAE